MHFASTSSGQLFVISAPSGVGKSTLIRNVLATCANLKFSVSCTTRPPRPEEINGKDYIFIEQEEFLRGIGSGRFLEWAEVHGNYYGTDRQPIEKWLSAGQDVILDIDVQGARMVRCAIPGTVTIFVLPPSLEELRERLRNRATESAEQLAVRFEAARRELFDAPWYDYVIVNDDLEEAAADLAAVLRAGRCSRVSQAPRLGEFLTNMVSTKA